MTVQMDPKKLNALAQALLHAARDQQLEHRVRSQDLPKHYFEDASGCTAAEVAQGFRELNLTYLNDGGSIIFNPKILEKAIENGS